MTRLPRFGFSRWDLMPEKDESTLGFFDRLLEREGEDSLNSYALLNGFSDTYVVMEEILDHLLKYPFPDHVKTHLRDNAALTHSHDRQRNINTVHLRGQILNRFQLRLSSKRWCPACVAEKPYRRIWFDLVSLTTCPYHAEDILDRSPEGKEVPFGRVGLNHLVADHQKWPESALRAFTFGHYVLGRLGCETPFAVEVLDQAELRHVIATCRLVGRIIAEVEPRDGRSAIGGDHELGFDTVRRGPSFTAEAIAEWARQKHGEMARVLPLKKLVKQALFVGERDCGNVVGPFLRKVANSANVLCKMEKRPALSDERIMSGGIAIKTLAGCVGLRRTSASLAMKKLGLLEERVLRMSASEAHVPIVRAFVENLVDIKTLDGILGLPRGGSNHLIKVGMVDVYHRTGRGRSVRCVSKEDACALAERLAQLPRVADFQNCRSLRSAARFLNLTPGALVVAVLKEQVKIAHAGSAQHGFGGIVIDVGERKGYDRPDETAVSLTEASAALAVDTGTVRELLDRGLLTSAESVGQVRYVARLGLQEFARAHAHGSLYRKALDMSQSQFDRSLAKAGVKPVVKHGVGLAKNTIFRRSEIVRALSLASDPLAPTDPDLGCFWERVVHLVENRVREVKLPVCFQPEGCWASTTYNPRLVRFRYRSQTKVFTVEFSPLPTGQVFEFDLSAPVKDGAEEALVHPLMHALAEAKAKAKRPRDEKAVAAGLAASVSEKGVKNPEGLQ